MWNILQKVQRFSLVCLLLTLQAEVRTSSLRVSDGDDGFNALLWKIITDFIEFAAFSWYFRNFSICPRGTYWFVMFLKLSRCLTCRLLDIEAKIKVQSSC